MGLHPGIRRFALIWGIALGLVAAGASTSWAADYHAAPGGTGTACSSGTPCSLPTAVGQANIAGFGRVLMAAGTYNLASTLDVTGGMDIGPEPGAANPTIHGPGVNNVVNVTNAGVVLHDVALTVNGGNTALRLLGGTAERISVTTTGGAPACSPLDGAILRDSVCWANSSGGSASGIWVVPPNIAPSTGNVFNVTAVGGHSGIQLTADVSGEVMTINATNVIAKGGVADVSTEPSGGGVTTLNLDHSNYASVDASSGGTITPPGTNGNQTAAPLLANLAGGDFHQLPGSPTIDAGAAGPSIGLLDADRQARVQSACIGGIAIPDIGAYEASPPIAAASCSGFVIGALRLNKKRGIGKLTVAVPGAGQLKATGKGLKQATASSSAAGDVVLKLRAKGRKLAALDRSGKVKLKVTLAWAPTGNPGSTQTDKVKLKKK
jgi:hypothetical protein